MNKWLFHQNGFTRTSLSATITGVSNFFEENMFLFFLHCQGPPPGGLLLFFLNMYALAQHLPFTPQKY